MINKKHLCLFILLISMVLLSSTIVTASDKNTTKISEKYDSINNEIITDKSTENIQDSKYSNKNTTENNINQVSNIKKNKTNKNLKTATAVNSASGLSSSGSYYLTNDINLGSKEFEIKGNFVLDGQGHTITGTSSKSLFTADIKDESGNYVQIVLKNCIMTNSRGGAVYVNYLNKKESRKSLITLENCTFLNCKTNGDGVVVADRSLMKVTNCIFTGCSNALLYADEQQTEITISNLIADGSTITRADGRKLVEHAEGNITFKSSETIIKTTPTLTISSSNVTIGQKNNITFTLINNTQNINSARIYYNISGPSGSNSITNNYGTTSNGKFSIEYIPTVVGTYTVKASFNENTYYYTTSTSNTFKATNEIIKTIPTLQIRGNTGLVNENAVMATVTLYNGSNPITGALITYNITDPNGNIIRNNYNTPTNYGEAKISIKPETIGTYTITATFTGNDNYHATIPKTTTFIATGKTTPTLTINTTDGTTHSANTIKFILSNNTQPINGVRIYFNITGPNGELLKENWVTPTNTEGIATTSYTPEQAGTYTITACYNGNDNYNKVTEIETFIVAKVISTPIFEIYVENKTVLELNEEFAYEDYYFMLTDIEGNQITSGTIYYNITNQNGDSFIYYNPLNGSGEGVLIPTIDEDLDISINDEHGNLLPAGIWTVKAFYDGDDEFYDSYATETFEITKIPTLIELHADINVEKETEITVKLINSTNNQGLSNKSIKLTITDGVGNTTTKFITTDSQGLGTYNYSTDNPGIVTITTNFPGKKC